MKLRDVVTLLDDDAILLIKCKTPLYGRREFLVGAGFIGSLTGHDALSCDVTKIRRDNRYGDFVLFLEVGDNHGA